MRWCVFKSSSRFQDWFTAFNCSGWGKRNQHAIVLLVGGRGIKQHTAFPPSLLIWADIMLFSALDVHLAHTSMYLRLVIYIWKSLFNLRKCFPTVHQPDLAPVGRHSVQAGSSLIIQRSLSYLSLCLLTVLVCVCACLCLCMVIPRKPEIWKMLGLCYRICYSSRHYCTIARWIPMNCAHVKPLILYRKLVPFRWWCISQIHWYTQYVRAWDR